VFTARYGLNLLNTIEVNIQLLKAVSWLRRLVAGLLPWRLRLDPRPVPFGISDGQSGERRVYLRVRRFSPITVIPPMFHYHLHLNTISKDERAKPENLQKRQCSLVSGGALTIKALVFCL
jgi:hypothetical protein